MSVACAVIVHGTHQASGPVASLSKWLAGGSSCCCCAASALPLPVPACAHLDVVLRPLATLSTNSFAGFQTLCCVVASWLGGFHG